ncbi:methyl-CpG binding domain protein [Trifolium pratense]|uniref:Methyl-CpG binding domain protein n=1 Tax=Trifolium pratense TaxID=57577 RepID=A0A2K3NPJ5_TRIPR|nr:methyl-CpG binding domain protein [Trifolium pratense]
MGKPKGKKSDGTKKKIDSGTKCNSKQQTAEKDNEHPEWLPDGWNVEFRTRKSGPAKGTGYKCYIDPSNTHKFYSKPEVLRHLETTKDSNCSSKKTKGTGKHPPSKEEEEEKCSSKHSPSKGEEKRTNSNRHSPSKEEDKCINMHSPSKGKEKYINTQSVTGEKSTVEDLPPGWIKEVKIRKHRSGIKKDWFYIDPVSGYVFHSKKDVTRYLESGDISRCAMKPSRRQHQDEDNSTPSPAAKRQKPKQSTTPVQKNFVAEELVESLELPDVNNSRKGQDVNVPSGTMVSPDTSGESLKVGRRFSQRLAGVEPVKLADNVTVTNDQTLLVPKRNLRKSRTTLAADMENKSPQHFNGVPEIEQPKATDTGNTLSEVVFKEQPRQLGRDKIEKNKPELHTNSNKSSKKKEPRIPCRASKRLAGSEPGLMNSISCEKTSKNKSKRSKEVIAELQKREGAQITELTDHAPLNGESGNKRIKSPKILPAGDNQPEKLEVDDEKSEPQLSFAFHYSWSDPCLDYAINTLTGVLPPVENSVDNGPSTVPETDIKKPAFDTVTRRSRGCQKNSDNGPATVHETDIQKTLFDNLTRRSKDSQNNLLDNVITSRDKNPPVPSNKSKRKKEVQVPMRLSKRLAGVEPEASPSDKALEYSSRKPCKEKPTANVVLTNGTSDHLYGGEETKLLKTEVPRESSRKSSKRLAGIEPEASPSDKALEYSSRKPCKEKPTANVLLTNGTSDYLYGGEESKLLKTRVLRESSRKSGKLYDAQTVQKEPQLQKVEAKNISDGRSKSELTLPFGESWSDPCLEFAFKTLTGALPVDSTAEIFKVMTPGVDNPPNNEFYGRVTTNMNGKTHDNSNHSRNMKECNMDGQSSKLLLGQPELRTSSTSGKNVPEFTNGESHSHEDNIIRNLEPVLRTSSISGKDVPNFITGESRSHDSDDIFRNLFGEPLYVEAENTTQLLHDSRTNAYSQIHEEPLKKIDQVAEGELCTSVQPPPFQTETLNHDNTGLQFCESFMNSWSDPCLEFAFKTLTGAIPVEDNLAIPGGIQEPANCHDGRDDVSALPDFGSSNFSQSDFSFHFDTGVKSTPGQQSSMSSSFPSLGLQGCPGVDPQQQYSQFNNNFQRR